jgi:hypothetical protein
MAGHHGGWREGLEDARAIHMGQAIARVAHFEHGAVGVQHLAARDPHRALMLAVRDGKPHQGLQDGLDVNRVAPGRGAFAFDDLGDAVLAGQ